MAPNDFKLTFTVVGQTDVNRLLRELEKLDDFFVASAAQRQANVPRITHILDDLARTNRLNLLEAAPRKELAGQLKQLLKEAPSVHISFAAEPPPKVIEKIVVWFRQNIHPKTLLQVGLQPSIAAGCVVRTPNKIFDMSLRSHLKDQESLLVRLIDGSAVAAGGKK